MSTAPDGIQVKKVLTETGTGPGLEHFFSAFRAKKFNVDVKEGPGREGRSDLNVQLTLR